MIAEHETVTWNAERRMAFTPGQFLRGAVAALLSFTAFSGAVYAVLLGAFVPAGLMIAWPSALAATILFSPGAYGLGVALRRVGNRFAHAAVFGAYGAVVGVLTTAVSLGLLGASSDLHIVMSPLGWINAGLSAVAVVLGRWWAMRLADRAGTTTRVRAACVRRGRHGRDGFRQHGGGTDWGRDDW